MSFQIDTRASCWELKLRNGEVEIAAGFQFPAWNIDLSTKGFWQGFSGTLARMASL